MLRDNAGIELVGLEEVPIPVDVHVLRATICSGVLTGKYEGSTDEIFSLVRRLWRDAVQDLRLPNGRAMVALDVDEALWTLSRLGCSKRGSASSDAGTKKCPAAPGCAEGRIVIKKGRCEINTTKRP
jgi:hypothetical protein